MAREMTASIRRNTKSQTSMGSIVSIVRGVVTAVAVTVLGVVVFALLIRWMSFTDTVISVFNQALKLASIFVGARACVGHGGANGVFKGATVGLLYMMLGIIAYAFLSGLSLVPSAYLADIGMGVAAGGLCGMIMANMKPKK